jgi:hypothetical protein
MIDKFPNDENGEALRLMRASGDDLSKERDIDFSVIFSDESSAKSFCTIILEYGMKLDCCKSEQHIEEWDVTVTKKMTPSYEGINSMETRLANLAAPLGGRNDGWGCFSVTR